MTRRALLLLVMAALLIPSAAWASHQFTDVPDDHLFHDDIGWLADNGVTLGCNPPDNDRFCPDDGVTRGEMAAFMRRLSEGRVVNAGSVSGRTAVQLAEGSSRADVSTTGGQGGENLTLATLRVRAPAPGAVKITSHISVDNEGPGLLWSELDSPGCGSAQQVPVASVTFWAPPTPRSGDSVATSWVAPVDQGAHTVHLCAHGNDPQDTLVVSGGGITVTWVSGNGLRGAALETATPSELRSVLDGLATAGGDHDEE